MWKAGKQMSEEKFTKWLENDPDLKDIENKFVESIQQNTVDLDHGDEQLIPLIAMIVQGTYFTMPDQVSATLKSGVAPEKILEVAYQLEPVIGISKVVSALKEIHQVYLQEQVQVTPAKQTDESGIDVQSKLYGTEIKNMLADLPTGSGKMIPAWLTEHFFENYYARTGL